MTATSYEVDLSAMEAQLGRLDMELRTINTEIRRIIAKLIREAKPLDDEVFWELTVEELSQLFKNFAQDGHAAYKRTTSEFIRKLVYEKEDPYLAIRYIKTYDIKVSALYRPLFGVIEGCGDDGYGDVLDSFPLFGRERYEKALKGEIVGTSEEQYQGENYISMSLTDALYDKMPRQLRPDIDEEYESIKEHMKWRKERAERRINQEDLY